MFSFCHPEFGFHSSAIKLKGLYHRRVFLQVCLQIDPESYAWGLSERSVDLK